MLEQLGPEAKEIIVLAQDLAHSMGHSAVRGEHLLLALFERMDKGLAREFADIGISYEQLFSAVQADFPTTEPILERDAVELSFEAQMVIVRSAIEARRFDSEIVLPKHIFIAFEWYGIAERGNFYAWELLRKSGPEHKIRILFSNIEFRTPSAKDDSQIPKVRRIADPVPSENQVWILTSNFPHRNIVLDTAQVAATKHGHNKINSIFLLLGLAMRPNTVACSILEAIGLGSAKLHSVIKENYGIGPWKDGFQMYYARSIENIYDCAREISIEHKSLIIEDEHFLEAFVRIGKHMDGCLAWKTIQESGKVERLISLLEDPTQLENLSNDAEKRLAIKEFHTKAQSSKESIARTDFLSKSTINLLSLAKAEALSLNRETIEPEHLFLAMLAMPSLDVIDIFKTLNIDIAHARGTIESFSEKVKNKKATNNELTFSQSTKSLLESAFTEARQLGKALIEPVHILLAIARSAHDENTESVISKSLNILELETKLITEVIVKSLITEVKPNKTPPRKVLLDTTDYELPSNFSETSFRVVENAHKEACRFGYPEIEPEHLLLGLVKETSNEVSNLFISRGVCVKSIEQEYSKFKDRGPGGSSKLRVSNMVQEIFNLASKECSNEVEPKDLLGYLILSMDLVTINILRSLGLEDLLEGAADYAPPAALLSFLNISHMDDYFYSNALKILLRAQELSRQFGHKSVENGHLLLALLEWHDDPVVKAFCKYGVKMDKLKTDLRGLRGIGITFNTKEIPLSQRSKDALRKATNLVDEHKSDSLAPGHLLLGILSDQCATTKKLLSKYDLPADLNDRLVIALPSKSEK
ncbi:MAG: hypothetical protein KIT34_00590 [Cyanobacteria bacterium TGS_CYA1]|nr:hypothetical protein [Cyanobacteria bacterium TGS_CYA1]